MALNSINSCGWKIFWPSRDQWCWWKILIWIKFWDLLKCKIQNLYIFLFWIIRTIFCNFGKKCKLFTYIFLKSCNHWSFFSLSCGKWWLLKNYNCARVSYLFGFIVVVGNKNAKKINFKMPNTPFFFTHQTHSKAWDP